MKTTFASPVAEFLANTAAYGDSSLSSYLACGAARVTAADIAGLRQLLPQVCKKAYKEVACVRLRRRLDIFVVYIQESRRQPAGQACRECAYVLYYFLQAQDLVPDETPAVGLLDDALMVEIAFNRNRNALRAHWEAHQRLWPDNL